MNVSGPLPQRGYLWQRDWTPAVIDSVTEASKRMQGIVILGAEINFAGSEPEIAKASIDWEVLKRQNDHTSVALRIAPFAGPFRAHDAHAETIANVTKALLADASVHQVRIEEFQLDFDCPASSLRDYRVWLSILREVVHPIRFVITALPAWLSESEFRPLASEVDGYVLQVHSVPVSNGRSAALCDPQLAKRWVARAAQLQLPFSVSLPTYHCSAGYRSDGKLLSVAMDSIQPAWPPGTRVLEFGVSADEIAALVDTWKKSRPAELRELLWYRIPIATDSRNWRWPTLSAVMVGRTPAHRVNVLQEGDNPIDLSIVNVGEADELLNATITVTWNGAELVAADALSGWNVRSELNRAFFTVAATQDMRLPPGGTRRIGWLRFNQATNLDTKFEFK